MSDEQRAVGRLALASGQIFRGKAFGAVDAGGVVTGEVVFNTALTGYQESLTDPSYAGQILVQTTPMIGNTGVNAEDVESRRVQVQGFVIHELTERPSNYRSERSLDGYLRGEGVIGLSDIDTRALTKALRSAGAVGGAITADSGVRDAELVATAAGFGSMSGKALVGDVAALGDRGVWDEDLGTWKPSHLSGSVDDGPVVLAMDCGAKETILRQLVSRGCEVRLVPHTVAAEDLCEMLASGEAQGLFVSNGPGDPAAVTQTVESLRAVLRLDPTPPVFGICLGHQLLSLAIGATTYKLPFGHRGANQPVREESTGRVSITSQNHGFAVDRGSLESAGAVVTHVHLNDGTVAGMRLSDKPVFSVQHHPEASPGPHDASILFDQFVAALGSRASAGGAV